VRLAVAGGCALGFAAGWNISNTGAVANALSEEYGISLAVVGLFTTALFVVHLVMQIPAGRLSDWLGPRRVGFVGLAILALANAAAMIAPEAGLALAARMVCGVGIALLGGGVAIAVVPAVEDWIGWRSPFVTALVVAVLASLVLAAGPADAPRRVRLHGAETSAHTIFSDSRLYRLAVVFAASFGLSVVMGNWVVELIDRHGAVGETAAGAIGALTLMLGVVTRPLGGWILRAHPDRARAAVAVSLAAGSAGAMALALANGPEVAVIGACVVGLAAGIPFSPAFTGAARTHPEAPATAVGVVNGLAALTIVIGTPLLGLTFSMSGAGRIGFATVAVLWAAALLALPSTRELGVTPSAALESR
jgi:MFS transporter, NNP family, nitrate/nitrite transporter